MKLSCKVINDLLPLYYDDVCSEETKMIVEEHLKECEGCRNVVEKMKVEFYAPQKELDEANFLKNIQKSLDNRETVDNYNRARYFLLFMLLFTLVNIVSICCNYSLFLPVNATLPWLLAIEGFAQGVHSYLYLLAVILILYIVSWILSKKSYVWMIISTILFAVDTIVMFMFFGLSFDSTRIIDVLAHLLILYSLINGSISGWKLKK